MTTKREQELENTVNELTELLGPQIEEARKKKRLFELAQKRAEENKKIQELTKKHNEVVEYTRSNHVFTSSKDYLDKLTKTAKLMHGESASEITFEPMFIDPLHEISRGLKLIERASSTFIGREVTQADKQEILSVANDLVFVIKAYKVQLEDQYK